MTEAEDQLEHDIWQAMKIFKVGIDEPLMFVHAVMHAARIYAVGDDVELTRARREALHLATAPPAGQTPASGCGGDGRTTPEPATGRSGVAGRSQVPVGGATLSTGDAIPDTPKTNGGN